MNTSEITIETYEADYGYHSYKLIYMDTEWNFYDTRYISPVDSEQDIKELGEGIREDRDALASDIGD